jgi:RNA polymerase sigma factor (sigma-70 family)
VSKIARALYRTLPPRIVTVEELEQVGWTGALDAAQRYRQDVGITLAQWCQQRIRGAILDWLSKNSPGSRDQQRRGTAPVRIDLEHAIGTVSSVPVTGDIHTRVTLEKLFRRARLQRRTSRILRAYYLKEQSAKQIASRFGISESRVSQLLRVGLKRLMAVTSRPRCYRRDRAGNPIAILKCGYCKNVFTYSQELTRTGKIRRTPHLPGGHILPVYCGPRCARKATVTHAKLTDPARLRHLYHDCGLSMKGVAEEIDCAPSAVVMAMRRFGIPARPQGWPPGKRRRDGVS